MVPLKEKIVEKIVGALGTPLIKTACQLSRMQNLVSQTIIAVK
jgi:hypothetical protein